MPYKRATIENSVSLGGEFSDVANSIIGAHIDIFVLCIINYSVFLLITFVFSLSSVGLPHMGDTAAIAVRAQIKAHTLRSFSHK